MRHSFAEESGYSGSRHSFAVERLCRHHIAVLGHIDRIRVEACDTEHNPARRPMAGC